MIGLLGSTAIGVGLVLWAARSDERPLVMGAVAIRLVIAIVVSFFLVPVGDTWVTSERFSVDDLKYYEQGRTFLEYGTLVVDPKDLGVENNPGFTYLMGALFLLFGDVWFMGAAVSFVAGAALPLAVVRLASALGFDRPHAMASGWIIACLPTTAFFSVTGYKDQLALLTLTMLITSLAELSRSGMSARRGVQIAALAAAMSFLRIGLLPLVFLVYVFGVARSRKLADLVPLLLLVAAGVVPFVAWLQSVEQRDAWTVAEITSAAGAGMASQVLEGGLSTWPLRVAVFLLLPYPATEALDDAWHLYTWLNVGWYALLCMCVPGAVRLWADFRETGSRAILLPLIWSIAVSLSLMVRGVPNMRYVLTIVPTAAIIGAYALTSHRCLVQSVVVAGVASAGLVVGYFGVQALI